MASVVSRTVEQETLSADPAGIAKGLVGADFDFVRQSIQLSEFRSLDKRMYGITPDKTD